MSYQTAPECPSRLPWLAIRASTRLPLVKMLDKRRTRPRDEHGRYFKAQRPDFERLIASFGESWNAWRMLAIATQGSSVAGIEDRSTSFDSRKGGTTASENERGTPTHWASNKFLILNSIKNAPDAKRYPKGQLKKYGPKSVEAVARRERPRPRW